MAGENNNQSITLQPNTPPVQQQPSQADMTPPNVSTQPNQQTMSGILGGGQQPQAPQYTGWQTHGVGRVLNTVLGGSKVVYQPGPDGTPVAQRVPLSSGEMFKNILGAAVLGLASGAGTHDFGEGFGRGVATGAAKAQNDQDRARADAQQDWENQMKAKEEGRRQQRFETEQTMAKANLEYLEQQKITEGLKQASYHLQNTEQEIKDYQSNAAYFAPQKTVLDAAGIKPKYTLTADQIMNRPETGVFRLPVGMVQVPVTGPDGKTTMEPEQLIAVYDQKDLNNAVVTKDFQDQIAAVMGHTEKTKTEQQWRDQVSKLIPVGSKLDSQKLGGLLPILQNNWATMREDKKFQAQVAESQAAAYAHSVTAAKAQFDLDNAKEDKQVREAFSLATSGEKLTPKQEDMVKKNHIKIASWLNTESAAAERELVGLSNQYNSMIKNGQTPDENTTSAMKAASDRYQSVNEMRQRFNSQFGGGQQQGEPGQQASPVPDMTPKASSVLADLQKNNPEALGNANEAFRVISTDPELNVREKLSLYKATQASIPDSEINNLVTTAKSLGVDLDSNPISKRLPDEKLKQQIVSYLVKNGYKVKSANEESDFSFTGAARKENAKAGMTSVSFPHGR